MSAGNLRVAVLVDRGQVPVFGLRALDSLQDCKEIKVFSCLNTRLRRKPLRHALYYALNLFTVRNPLTRLVPVANGQKPVTEQVEFSSGYEGAWQTLPPGVVTRLAQFDIIIKLGMGLLRVPPPDRLPAPILSWHHGDPDRFRGRPAGFWETVEGSPVVGQIIQILSNKLDAGGVVAFAETKVRPYSYRATLLDAYRHSHLLLNAAVRRALRGETLAKTSSGRNYRLPSNLEVIKFLHRAAGAFVRRLLYGAFWEKRWQVSLASVQDMKLDSIAEGRSFPSDASWQTLPTPRPYLFLADPFFSREPSGILVEAFSRESALGEILLMDGGTDSQRLFAGSFHLSYPSTFRTAQGQLIVPEMAQAGEQRSFLVRDGRMVDAGAILIEGARGIIDPTLIEHQGRIYLFANEAEQGSGALCLWSALSLADEFRPHPASPVRISPAGARMGGAFLQLDKRLIRFGQNFLGDYGDGLFAFEVETLTPDSYRERLIGSVAFKDRHGPHTLNFDRNRMVFDWYVRRWSALAGARRLSERLAERRAARSRALKPDRLT